MTEARKTLATRRAEAVQSASRAAGYCALEHPDGGAWSTRPLHIDRRHVDVYNGRQATAAASGTKWVE